MRSLNTPRCVILLPIRMEVKIWDCIYVHYVFEHYYCCINNRCSSTEIAQVSFICEIKLFYYYATFIYFQHISVLTRICVTAVLKYSLLAFILCVQTTSTRRALSVTTSAWQCAWNLPFLCLRGIHDATGPSRVLRGHYFIRITGRIKFLKGVIRWFGTSLQLSHRWRERDVSSRELEN